MQARQFEVAYVDVDHGTAGRQDQKRQFPVAPPWSMSTEQASDS